MVLLPLGDSLPNSASAPVLPKLRCAAEPSASFTPAIGLSAPDASLLPRQRRHRLRQHVGCQTEVSELSDLRSMQVAHEEMRRELATVKRELDGAERRLRHEVRAEMEARLRKFETKTREKVAFIKQRSESSLGALRRATDGKMRSAVVQAQRQLQAQLTADTASLTEAASSAEREAQRQQCLTDGYMRENRDLRMQLNALRESIAGRDAGAAAIAQLEAAVAREQATVKALREQIKELNRPSH